MSLFKRGPGLLIVCFIFGCAHTAPQEATPSLEVAITSSHFFVGKELSVSVKIRNKGIKMARDIKIRISGGPSFLLDLLVGTKFISQLPPGQTREIFWKAVMPPSIPQSFAQLRFAVSADGRPIGSYVLLLETEESGGR